MNRISQLTKENDTIVFPGKVLGIGDISKKIKIAALSFSEKAKETLKEKKIEFLTINEEIKKNPDGKKIKILEVK